jgi:hypothetical protein
MGKTSAAVKNEWNRKNYDRIEIFVPKDNPEKPNKEQIKAYAKKREFDSVNSYINHLIEEDMKK